MNIEPRYCQSCGMPLDISRSDMLGTNQDNTTNSDYCCYCYQHGEYTMKLSMKEAIQTWSGTCNQFNQNVGTDYTSEEFRSMLQTRMPSLKRWHQKDATKNAHFEIVNKIQSYINSHLFDKLDTETLSGNANLSKFHFLRKFKEITGESVGNYILRLRLEHIAHLLLTTQLSLLQIIQQVNYQSKHSLSKAFKKYFGIPPSEFRLRYAQIDNTLEESPVNIQPDIKKVKGIHVLYRSIDQRSKTKHTLRNLWTELIAYAEQLNLKKGSGVYHLSLSLDDPLITQYQNCRFLLGITVSEEVKPKGTFCVMQIPDGDYAVFTHRGDYSSLHRLYRYIYLNWLPKSGYRQKNTLSFELYRNTPLNADSASLETEIYIPVEKNK